MSHSYVERMNQSISDLLPQVVALLAGGLGGSLGIAWAARRPAGRRRLGALGPWVFAGSSLVLTGACVGLAYLLVRSMLDTAAADPTSLSVPGLFALGVVVGLPLGLPGLVAGWTEARARERERLKKRDWVPTKDDRRAYARQIVSQIVEVSPRPRTLTATIAGDGGTVLRFEGDIDAEEGERLTAALRADLREVGFKRVEGADGSRDWWTRV